MLIILVVLSAEKVSVGDLVNVSGSKVKYELLHITPLTSTTCVSKLRRKKSEEIILSREPLFRLSGKRLLPAFKAYLIGTSV